MIKEKQENCVMGNKKTIKRRRRMWRLGIKRGIRSKRKRKSKRLYNGDKRKNPRE